ncbi:MAG: iron-containing alcohol dehydrogenase [Alphaproteobacteria bacterium]|nr:iron-containing alcohol dehydrogenase [Alphaproteobacteria bacterium]
MLPSAPIDIRWWPNRVYFAVGGVAQARHVLADLRVNRALVVCGKTVARGPMLAKVRNALGGACAGVFEDVQNHTPLASVKRGVEAVRRIGADAIVSVGGGSATDCGKGIAILHASAGDLAPYAVDYGRKGFERLALPAGGLVHVAIPTTTGSASEVMPTAGVRDVAAKKKLLFWDARIVPDAVIYDPEMTVHCNAHLTAASGMTAMARCIEALYSRDRNPISTALALHGARLLNAALPKTIADPNDLAARADCLLASGMSGIAAINAMASVVHAICHPLGGRFGLQHGIGHAMLLAPALRRVLPAIGADAGFVLEALGSDRAHGAGSAEASAAAAAAAMTALLGRLPLPQRLREVGIERANIDQLTADTMGDYMMAFAPTRLDAEDVGALIAAAW